jgi:hypothetical protein
MFVLVTVMLFCFVGVLSLILTEIFAPVALATGVVAGIITFGKKIRRRGRG